MSENVGKRIKEIREEKGISVIELAEKLGVSRATIYRYENNEIIKFPIGIILPIAEALHVNPAYLLGWSDNPSTNSSPDMEKALALYEQYQNAIPQVQDAVEALLKSSRPDS